MLYAGLGLASIAGIVSLICFILVLVQMFQRGQTGLGIVTLLLALCTGVGGLIAFVYGWIKATEWNLKNVMLAWTVSIVVAFVGYGMAFAGGFSIFNQLMNDPNIHKQLRTP